MKETKIVLESANKSTSCADNSSPTWLNNKLSHKVSKAEESDTYKLKGLESGM